MSNHPDFVTAFAQPFTQADLNYPDRRTGKVRENYAFIPQLDNQKITSDNVKMIKNVDKRLLITTDRLSAFDRVLAAVPYKGQVLNQLSGWWFDQTKDIVSNHKIAIPDPNVLIATAVTPFPIEVIVRGFITGVTSTALWHRYSLGEREIYGYQFAEGLRKNQLLPQPIITPTTKGGITGHDERLTCAEVVEKGYLDAKTWDYVQSAALSLFQRGQLLAKKAGLLLVDTKYEFGTDANGNILLIDEVHTPDSSRFWLAESYHQRFESDQEPENFDKEIVRLKYVENGYRGEGEAPKLSNDFWQSVSERYITIYERLTGTTFNAGEYPVLPRIKMNLAKNYL